MTSERNIRVHRRYTWKLYPTVEQATALHEQRMMIVDLWNALLQRHEDIWRRTRGQKGVVHSEARSSYTFFDMTAEITDLRRECAEWAALSVWSAHGAAEALDNAFKAFFRRAKAGAGAQSGYPRYRRRRDGTTIPHRHSLFWPAGPGKPSDTRAKSGAGSGCLLRHKHGRSWSLALKAVDGPIHTRGMLPENAPWDKMSAANVLWQDGRWWFSVCVEMAPRRVRGQRPVAVDFDLIDGLARIDGALETPELLSRIAVLAQDLDRLKSERDRRWPRAARNDPDWQEADEEIRRLSARIARIRRDCLHVWTTRIVRRASDLTIRRPRISEHTASPHGDTKEWGANTKAVSELNRSVLSYAPAMAVQMFEYKAEEAGIRCDVLIDETPAIAVGSALVQAGKKLRRSARAAKTQGPGSPG